VYTKGRVSALRSGTLGKAVILNNIAKAPSTCVMADVLTPQQRSFNMSRIRNRDTKPEIIVRSIVHRLGYRYRLHKSELPGKPDLVLVRHAKIINVHGCFFHMHNCKYGKVVPASNAEFWSTKRLSNVKRDKRNLRLLRKAGWKVMTIWECETKDVHTLTTRIEKFLFR
jgi:DNA mismatch endonuclease (patch repair protein)